MLFVLTAVDVSNGLSEEVFATRESPLFVPQKGDIVVCFEGRKAEVVNRVFTYRKDIGVELTLEVEIDGKRREDAVETFRTLGRTP